jgi:hypothetical protein
VLLLLLLLLGNCRCTSSGDLLMVELCQLGPLPGDEWGFTGGWQELTEVLGMCHC